MKSSFENLFGSDIDVAEVWMGVNSKEEDIFFYLREMNCEIHEKCYRKYSRALERTRNNEKSHNKVLCQILSESIIVDWKGVLDDNGKRVKPTPENKVDNLVKWKKLMMAVMDASSTEANFRADVDAGSEQDTKENL
jgi:hypothetical protein